MEVGVGYDWVYTCLYVSIYKEFYSGASLSLKRFIFYFLLFCIPNLYPCLDLVYYAVTLLSSL